MKIFLPVYLYMSGLHVCVCVCLYFLKTSILFLLSLHASCVVHVLAQLLLAS